MRSATDSSTTPLIDQTKAEQAPAPPKRTVRFASAGLRAAQAESRPPESLFAQPEPEQESLSSASDEEPAVFSLKVLLRHWRTWALSAAGFGYLVSTLTHSLALITLSWFVLGGSGMSGGGDALQVAMGDGAGGGGGDDTLSIDTGFDTALPSETSPTEPQLLDLVALGTNPDLVAETDAVVAGMMQGAADAGSGGGENGGEGSGDDNGLGLALGWLPPPPGAVRKGSFTAWTTPEDPRPGAAYDIVIEVKLNDKTGKYRLNDLTGRVVGTDGYVQAIRFSRDDVREINKGRIQVRISVPGAQKLVRDVIKIESRRLREKQSLEIVF